MLLRLHKRGQSTMEYAIVFGVVGASLIAMQTYVKRSMQAKVKDGGDLLTSVTGEVGGKSLGTTNQYEPYYLTSSMQSESTADTSKTTSIGGGAATTETTDRGIESGWQQIEGVSK
mgnify:FL=1